MVDPMSFYFNSKSLAEKMNLTLSHFALMKQKIPPTKSALRCLSLTTLIKHKKNVTSFLGILNLKGKTAAKITNAIKKIFFWQNLLG